MPTLGHKAKRALRAVATAVALGTIAAAGLTGCSSSQNTGSSKATINWWYWDATGTAAQYVSKFEKANPNIKVIAKQYSNADYLTVLRPSLASAHGPDVFEVGSGSMLANYGPLATNLTPLLQKTWGSGWKSKFDSFALNRMSLKGTQPALPNYLSAGGLLYYNNTLVKKLGITVPKDLDQMASTCKKVTATGLTCLALGAKDAWEDEDVFFTLANSVDSTALYSAIAGKSSWTNSSLTRAMTAWQKLFTSGVAPSGATTMTTYPDAFNAFLSNKAVFLPMGTWNTPGTQTKTGVAVSQKGVSTKITGEFLSSSFPATETGGTPSKLFGDTNGWSINSRTKNSDAALKFVQFLSAGGGQKIVAANASFPVTKGVDVSTSDVAFPSQVANIKQEQTQIGDLAGFRAIPYPALELALQQALSSVAAGSQTPAAALAAVQTASQSVKR